MKRHSEHESTATQISYILNSSQLRLSRFQLKVQNSVHEPFGQDTFTFEDGPVRIGSLPHENHIVLTDETVSRKHCEIIREGDVYLLRDLESTNGTFMNQVRIKEVFLTQDVEYQVGQTKIFFQPIEEKISIKPSPKSYFGRIISNDLKMREIFSIIEKIKHTDTTVIIEGETGTGKDILAQTIHESSRRAQQPFVVLDCSAIPEHLIESELFGHEKGSFTGAFMARQGLFEQANGGTIFLDELGELSLELQPKLLRVLETRKVRRVGGQTLNPVDVRVIAATNRNLEQEVKLGRFREDLFYRLSVVRIFLPPLRERIIDLPVLIEHFLKKSKVNQKGSQEVRLRKVSPEAFRLMNRHTWPGNIRELINIIERACTLADGDELKVEDLPASFLALKEQDQSKNLDDLQGKEIRPLSSPKEEDTLNENINQHFFTDEETNELEPHFEGFKVAKERWITLFERDYILTALKRSKYNISHASREAGIDRKYFRKLMQKYEIETP